MDPGQNLLLQNQFRDTTGMAEQSPRTTEQLFLLIHYFWIKNLADAHIVELGAGMYSLCSEDGEITQGQLERGTPEWKFLQLQCPVLSRDSAHKWRQKTSPSFSMGCIRAPSMCSTKAVMMEGAAKVMCVPDLLAPKMELTAKEPGRPKPWKGTHCLPQFSVSQYQLVLQREVSKSLELLCVDLIITCEKEPYLHILKGQTLWEMIAK